MDASKIEDDVLKWFKTEITVERGESWYEITLPLLRSDNDYLQVYLIQEGNRLYLSDDGYIFNMLDKYEMELSKREEGSLLRDLKNPGLHIQNQEIQLDCTEDSYVQQLLPFAQAIIKAETLLEAMGKMSMYLRREVEHDQIRKTGVGKLSEKTSQSS